MHYTREEWFPSPVWMFDHPDPDTLNAELLRLLMAERATDPAGLPGKSTILGWHSRDDLHRRPAFAPLVEFVGSCVGIATAELQWDFTLFRPALANCWAIVNGPGAGNVVHTHPLALISGVYYVQAAKGAGDLFFGDPRPAAVATDVPVTTRSALTFSRVTYTPQPGRLLLFPAWLPHGVEPNTSSSDRICISFNINANWK